LSANKNTAISTYNYPQICIFDEINTNNAIQTPGNSLFFIFAGHTNFGSFVSIAPFQKRIFHECAFLEGTFHTNPKEL
jgi:hypothetical protein